MVALTPEKGLVVTWIWRLLIPCINRTMRPLDGPMWPQTLAAAGAEGLYFFNENAREQRLIGDDYGDLDFRALIR